MRVLIFGLGYTGAAVARAAIAAGVAVVATSRDPAGVVAPPGATICHFEDAAPEIALATHILATAPPGAVGDPVLARYEAALQAAPQLRWVGYLSTTGVYGDRQGGWVDEDSDVRADTPRATRRIEAEQTWARLADHVAVDLFRVAGIYGPGRSALDDVRSGRARRVIKPGHAFGRTHRDDIAGAVLAAMRQSLAPGRRVLHLADDQPEESAVVTAYAAALLGLAAPPAIAYAEAALGMSEMARSFWADNRKVASRITQERLGYRWKHPSYREGLASILAEERGEGGDQ
ncbi:MAG: SDR family NAD(P)-dependent oxidoreductase [Acetobacteraceae bacterium]|nr:SDR family NAD(P)-dependent oxidoreductase [Acetobacteraceae bacterium]